MQVTHGFTKILEAPRKQSRPTRKSGAKETVAEINAYIAIRDDLLAEAEQLRTRAKIDSVSAANNFVATCLKPARPPYEAQCLPEINAVRERKRCEAVRVRIAELHSQIGARSNDQTGVR